MNDALDQGSEGSEGLSHFLQEVHAWDGDSFPRGPRSEPPIPNRRDDEPAPRERHAADVVQSAPDMRAVAVTPANDGIRDSSGCFRPRTAAKGAEGPSRPSRRRWSVHPVVSSRLATDAYREAKQRAEREVRENAGRYCSANGINAVRSRMTREIYTTLLEDRVKERRVEVERMEARVRELRRESAALLAQLQELEGVLAADAPVAKDGESYFDPQAAAPAREHGLSDVGVVERALQLEAASPSDSATRLEPGDGPTL
jgi:hypothetical protein